LKKVTSVVKYLLFSFIGLFLLWLAFRGQSIDELREGFSNVNYFWVLLAVVLAFLSHISRAIRWNMLIKPLGYEVSKSEGLAAVLIGYLVNLGIPRMGELSRCVTLNRTNQIPVNKLFGTVVVERMVDFLCLLLFIIVAFILSFKKLLVFLTETIGVEFNAGFILQPVYILLVSVLLLGGIAFLIILKRSTSTTGFIYKLKELIRGFAVGLKTVKTLENKWAFLAHSVFIWTMYFLMTYLCFFAFPATSSLDLLAALNVFVIGSLGFIMPSPGGIGTFHFAVREALAMYHVSAADGVVFATIVHGIQTLLILVGGSISLVSVMFIIKNKRIAIEGAATNPA
jgi:glycosyltransferase 2 family protein